MLCAVPTEELFGLSDVIKFKLNTSGVTDDDVISARLGVYVRKLRSSTPRRQYVSSPRPNRLSQMVRVQISDVTWLHRVQALRRRTVYNVGYDGQWIMFEASLRILVTTRKCRQPRASFLSVRSGSSFRKHWLRNSILLNAGTDYAAAVISTLCLKKVPTF